MGYIFNKSMQKSFIFLDIRKFVLENTENLR